MTSALRLGTRGSQLARIQSGLVATALEQAHGVAISEVIIRTDGDDLSKSIFHGAKPGVFVSALREALIAGEVDFIVHSFKDLPSAPFAGITLAAVPQREDNRDVVVCDPAYTLATLPAGSVVGTSSPRRAARVLHARPDLRVLPIRGNVDSRLAKVASGEYNAAILAAAGLNRLGQSHAAVEYLNFETLLPAPGQGALAIECRAEDTELLEKLAALDHAESHLVVAAERAVLVGVKASCSTAIGAVATWENGVLEVTAELSHPTQDWHERASVSAELPAASSLSEAHQLGRFVAEQLMATPLGAAIAELGG
jgi:hydroxymethylbilane synthase